MRKQDWYHEYLQSEKAEHVQFLGRFDLTSDRKIIAKDIIKTLKLTDEVRKSCDNWEQYLTQIIIRAEESRILVLRNSIVGDNTYRKLDVDEFKGFAISDSLAPLIFINENDYKTAQIFTLVHEMVHLWIGESGVSNPDYMLRSNEQKGDIEQFCDAVAAEVLVPIDDFEVRWEQDIKLEDKFPKLARHYRVSQFVILRRAYDSDKITRNQFTASYDDLLHKIRTRSEGGGGNYFRLVLSRNSTTLTKSLVSAANEGQLLPTETARLLNIKISKLNAVQNFIMLGDYAGA